jgi:hypothetical protein
MRLSVVAQRWFDGVSCHTSRHQRIVLFSGKRQPFHILQYYPDSIGPQIRTMPIVYRNPPLTFRHDGECFQKTQIFAVILEDPMTATKPNRTAALLNTTAVALAASFLFASVAHANEPLTPLPTSSNISQTGAGANEVSITNDGQAFFLNASPDGASGVVQDSTTGANTLWVNVQNTAQTDTAANYLFVSQTGDNSIALLNVDGGANTVTLTEVRTDNDVTDDFFIAIAGDGNTVSVSTTTADSAADLIDIKILGNTNIVEVTTDAFARVVLDLQNTDNATVTVLQQNNTNVADDTFINAVQFTNLDTTGVQSWFNLTQVGAGNTLELTNYGESNNITIRQENRDNTTAINDLTMTVLDSGVNMDLTFIGDSSVTTSAEGSGNNITLNSNVEGNGYSGTIATTANVFGNNTYINSTNFDDILINIGSKGSPELTAENRLTSQGNVNFGLPAGSRNEFEINNDTAEDTTQMVFEIGTVVTSNDNIMTFYNDYVSLTPPTGFNVVIDGSNNSTRNAVDTVDVDDFDLNVSGNSNSFGVLATRLGKLDIDAIGNFNVFDITAVDSGTVSLYADGDSNKIGGAATGEGPFPTDTGLGAFVTNVGKLDLRLTGESNRVEFNNVTGSGAQELDIDLIGNQNNLYLSGTMAAIGTDAYDLYVRGLQNNLTYVLGDAAVAHVVIGNSFVGSVTPNATNTGYITSFGAGGTGYMRLASGSSTVTVRRGCAPEGCDTDTSKLTY